MSALLAAIADAEAEIRCARRELRSADTDVWLAARDRLGAQLARRSALVAMAGAWR